MATESDKIGAYWDRVIAERGQVTPRKRPIRIPGHKKICSMLHQAAYGSDDPRWGEPLLVKLEERYADRVPFKHGIAVACGNGRKEMDLISRGLVERFTFYELAAGRIETGQRLAERRGIADRVDFRLGDAFAAPNLEGQFDLVVWMNALHHMMDVPAALEWSRNVLQPGGALLLDDYVGPDRFQYSPDIVDAVNEIRHALPADVFEPDTDYKPRKQTRAIPDPAFIAGHDPSEAADSQRTLLGLEKHFPNHELFVKSSGVVIWGLQDIVSKLLDPAHDRLIDRAIELDRALVSQGRCAYAAAIADTSDLSRT